MNLRDRLSSPVEAVRNLAINEVLAAIARIEAADVNKALAKYGLRVVALPRRRDLITISEIEEMLTDEVGKQYDVLLVAADDLNVESSEDGLWPAWACSNGIYSFTRERAEPPTRESHNASVLEARERKNDPDGLHYASPPVVMHLGAPIGDSHWVFLRERQPSGSWNTASRLPGGMLRWWKKVLGGS